MIDRQDITSHQDQKVSVTRVLGLYVYPIKSCRGIKVERSALTGEGLQYDRRFMFIDDHNKFMTIRQVARMTMIRVALKNPEVPDQCEIAISIERQPDVIHVPAHPSRTFLQSTAVIETVQIWSSSVSAYIFPRQPFRAISDFLGQPVRLAYCTPALASRAFAGTDTTLNGISGTVGFADVYPLQVASMASLNDLNLRLAERCRPEVDIERFRPNIVIEGITAWEEDSWLVVAFISVAQHEGKVVVDILCRCARCRVPNVASDTGTQDLNEPWQTLMSFRRIDPGITYKPCFGMLGTPRLGTSPFSQEDPTMLLGHIQVGDYMRVEECTAKHRYLTST